MHLTMKQIILLTIFLAMMVYGFTQKVAAPLVKPVVDTPFFFSWPTLQNWPAPAISNNGQFALYSIRNVPAGKHSLTVQRLKDNRKTVFIEVRQAAFTDDSRYAVALQSGDSLCLLTLANNRKSFITGVKDFRLFMREGEEWLAYTTKEPRRTLSLKNVSTGVEHSYENVESYLLAENANSLILQSASDMDRSRSIRWVNLSTNSEREIWKGTQESNLVLSKDGTQLAFLVRDSSTASPILWLYCSGDEKARILFRNLTTDMPGNMELNGIQSFSKDNSRLFVQLRQIPQPKKLPPLVALNVWSYTDAILQSQQLHECSLNVPSYLAVLNMAAPSSFQRLQFENENIASEPDSLLLLTFRQGDSSERYWNKSAVCTTYLVTTSTGNRTEIPIDWPQFSPTKKYVIGYGKDKSQKIDLFVYEIGTGITRNITASLPPPPQDENADMLSTQKYRNLALAGWLDNETSVLLYDNYDIWQVDPCGVQPPLNLTNGRKQKWQFRLAGKEMIEATIQPRSVLHLIAFNKINKRNGFYSLVLGKAKGPNLLFSGNYSFSEFVALDGRSHFQKARDTAIYLVKRESATESPNIFVTSNFRNFTSLSSINPESSFNWLTSELISFKTSDSIPSQAILYKPENFDSSKKYPVIIQYYEKKSDELNRYRRPVVSNGGELDIPWFVSRGYLVLLPDIQYKIGEPGVSALQAVEGAARFIADRAYVDKDHIGIQGHSFGGYETNYIVTHSNMFAAAMTSAGVSNLVSDFGNLWPGEMSRQEYWEVRNGRIGTTPWENQDLYVKNSPIFAVNNVTTPILLMQNKKDKNVHFEESLQFFTGLRRVGKPCWMLEYDNGGHGVWGNEYKDYLLRMTQFFDHYLKGTAAPKWMTRGIPASMKGIDSGLELDSEIATPGPGLLIDNPGRSVNNTSSQANANRKAIE